MGGVRARLCDGPLVSWATRVVTRSRATAMGISILVIVFMEGFYQKCVENYTGSWKKEIRLPVKM
jgi:hypothetical protein